MKKIILLSFLQFIVFLFASAQVDTYYGQGAGNGNSGAENTSYGYVAGDVVTGSANTFLGAYSGMVNTSGYRNAYIGYATGRYSTTAFYNVFVGTDGGYKNTTGCYNVFLGHAAGYSNTTASSNVYIGESCASNNVTGANNTFLGAATGVNAKGSGNVFLGYNSGYNEAGSNKLYIDNSSTSTPLIYGDFSSRQIGINALPNTSYALTVGGTIYATGVYVNGTAIGATQWTNSGSNSYYNGTGNIGIGSSNPDYKLTVNGTIHSKEIKIDVSVPPDYVFEQDYTYPSLKEVQSYVAKNHHLPEVPSASEMEKNGVMLGDMSMLLLKKVEELTLYMIDLKKENEDLKSRIETLESKK